MPLRDPAIDLLPIEHLDGSLPATTGRPRKHPPMPDLGLNSVEQALFDGFMSDFLDTYPDIAGSDYRLLWMAATRYIAGLRLIKYEMQSGKTITMSRQHPLVELRALLDQLNVTRRARSRTTPAETADEAELKALLMSISSAPLGGAKQQKQAQGPPHHS